MDPGLTVDPGLRSVDPGGRPRTKETKDRVLRMDDQDLALKLNDKYLSCVKVILRMIIAKCLP